MASGSGAYLARSYPAAFAEPRFGSVANSESLLTRSSVISGLAFFMGGMFSPPTSQSTDILAFWTASLERVGNNLTGIALPLTMRSQ